jgi:hypothetical protein
VVAVEVKVMVALVGARRKERGRGKWWWWAKSIVVNNQANPS